jgi:hypothetical protein
VPSTFRHLYANGSRHPRWQTTDLGNGWSTLASNLLALLIYVLRPWPPHAVSACKRDRLQRPHQRMWPEVCTYWHDTAMPECQLLASKYITDSGVFSKASCITPYIGISSSDLCCYIWDFLHHSFSALQVRLLILAYVNLQDKLRALRVKVLRGIRLCRRRASCYFLSFCEAAGRARRRPLAARCWHLPI